MIRRQPLAVRLCSAGLLLALLCLLVGTVARAAEQYSEDAVKAAFLYRFAGYVDWPEEDPANTPFTIAVLGDDGVVNELQRLLPGKRIKNRPAQVRRIKRFSELAGAQILYVGAARAAAVRNIASATAGHPVLIVTDEERGLEEGSIVNFLLVDQRVRFEISLEAAERAGLKISSELLSVAARVQGARLRSEIFWPVGLPGFASGSYPERSHRRGNLS